MPANDDIKAELRASMIGRRRSLSESDVRRASTAAGRLLRQIEDFARARTIGAYMAVNGELDPAPVIEAAIEQGKQPCMPVLDERHALQFAPMDPQTPMQRNRYGIPEPVCEAGALITPGRLDVVIVPLVAFDARGHRLGMGAGYYDRALAGTTPGQPLRIGYAYEFQRVETVDPEPWDIPMDYVVTEQRIYRRGEPDRVSHPGRRTI